MKVLWTCQQNLAVDIAWWDETHGAIGYGPSMDTPPVCAGTPRWLDLDRNVPESEWPECDKCGKTMLPFMEAIEG